MVPAERGDLVAVLTAMSVVNDAVVSQGPDGRWGLVGEPTEGALRTLGLKAGFDPSGYPRTAVLPFDSEHKYMATANTTPEGHQVVLVKGAPDRLLDRSTTELSAAGPGAAGPAVVGRGDRAALRPGPARAGRREPSGRGGRDR